MARTLDEIVDSAPVIGPSTLKGNNNSQSGEDRLNAIVDAAPDLTKKQIKLDEFANNSVITATNHLGQFLTDAFNAASFDVMSGLSRLAPLAAEGMPSFISDKVNDETKNFQSLNDSVQDDFANKYGDSDAAMGFKEALSGVAASIAPEAKLSDLGQVYGIGKAMLEKMPQTAKSIADFMTRKASQGAAASVIGDNPDDPLSKSIEQGAGINLALGSVGAGIKKGIQSIGNKSGEQIIKDLNTLGDIPATGADILDSSPLRQAQANDLAYLPGSGQDTKSREIKNKIQDEADSVHGELLNGKDKTSLLNQVQESALNRYHKVYDDAGNDYDKVVKYLKDNGFTLSNKNSRTTGKRLLNAHIEAVKQQPSLKNIPLQEMLSDYANAPVYGRNKTADFEIAKAGKSKLYQMMQESEDSHERGILNQMYNSVQKDLKSVGDTQSKKMAADADKKFKEQVAPFKNKQLSKFVHGKVTPSQLFTKFIKNARTEDPQMVDILANILNPEEKKMIGAHIFRNDLNHDGSVNFTKFINHWKNLGDATKQAFFTPNIIKKLDSLVKKKELSGTALSSLVNPATGQTVERGGAQKYGYGLWALALRNPIINWMALAPIAGARGLQQAANSKTILEAIANVKMSKDGEKSSLSPAMTALLSSLGGS